MLRNILVGLDGSPFSAAAVELGIRWAKQFNCQLVAVGVIDEPTIRGPQSVPIGGGAFKNDLEESRLEDARQRVERFLSEFAIRCSREGVACKLLEEVGLPHEQICKEAQRYDLVMMGRETYYHFETQATSDETLRQVLQSSPRPVVAVPEVLPEGKGTLVAYDGSSQAARVLQSFLSIGLAALEDLHIVSVHSTSTTEAAKCADRAVEYLGFHGVAARPVPISAAHPGPAILDKAHELNAQLLVMGCFGQSKLREFFVGSVTRHLLDHSDLPLFLYH